MEVAGTRYEQSTGGVRGGGVVQEGDMKEDMEG